MDPELMQTKLLVEIVGCCIAASAMLISVIAMISGRRAKRTAGDADTKATVADARSDLVCKSNVRLQATYEEKIEALETQLTLANEGLDVMTETLADTNLELESAELEKKTTEDRMQLAHKKLRSELAKRGQHSYRGTLDHEIERLIDSQKHMRMTDLDFLSSMQTINTALRESGYTLVAPNKNFGEPLAIAIRKIHSARFEERRVELTAEGRNDGRRNCIDDLNKFLAKRSFPISEKRTATSMIERLTQILNEGLRSVESNKEDARLAQEYRECLASVTKTIRAANCTEIRELANGIHCANSGVSGTLADAVSRVIEQLQTDVAAEEQKYLSLAEHMQKTIADATVSLDNKLHDDDPVPF